MISELDDKWLGTRMTSRGSPLELTEPVIAFLRLWPAKGELSLHSEGGNEYVGK